MRYSHNCWDTICRLKLAIYECYVGFENIHVHYFQVDVDRFTADISNYTLLVFFFRLKL